MLMFLCCCFMLHIYHTEASLTAHSSQCEKDLWDEFPHEDVS